MPSQIDVDKIRHTNGTDALTFDTSGNTNLQKDLKFSSTAAIKNSAGNNILSESGGTITLTTNSAVIEGSSSGDLVRITQTGTGNALVVEDSANPDSTPFVVDSSGNLMLGGAANSWSTLQAVQIDRASISGYAGNSYLSHNFYANSGGSKYIASGGASQIRFADNQIIFNRASSGTADATLSFSESMRIDSSGNVGIGNSTPSYKLDITGPGTAGASTLRLNDAASAADSKHLLLTRGASTAYVGIAGSLTNDPLVISRSGNYDLLIDSNGNVLVGTTSVFGISSAGHMHIAGGPSQQLYLRNTTATAGKHWRVGPDGANNALTIYNQNGTGVYIGDGNTSWTASSDERLKTDLIPIENAVEKVATLRAVTGRFKTDDENKSRSFLIAQDVQKVLPEAIHIQNDEQGTLGLAYTDIIPLLVAAIKEYKFTIESQQSQIDALTSRIEALETN